MADKDYAEPDGDKDDKTEPKSDWSEIHKTALEEYDRDWAREKSNIADAYDDLKFRRGRLEDQWDALALQARKGRPCHVINKLPQFIRQVTGDIRQSRPGIKVVPVDSDADIETAEVRAGMIRYVENRSKAKHVYTTGADSQVTCGIGHWAVTTEYAPGTTINKEVRIIGIEDGVGVLWDADSFLPTRSDADHCFVPTDYTSAKFKKMWPDATADGFDTGIYGLGSGGAFDSWATDDFIRVMQYWKKKPSMRTLAVMPDGTIEDLTDQVKGIPAKDVNEGLNFYRQQTGAKIEQRESYTICRYLLTMAEILEEEDWPGMHIPVIPAIGEEVRVGRDIYRHGIVRYARDPQRRVNYFSSAETEIIALQPKAPYVGTKKQFQDNYPDWETANTDNLPFIEYTPDPAAPGPPQRIAPPQASQAVQLGSQNAYNDMKEVIGIYDSSLGAKSNEASGVAIARRDAQGDTGTFVYHDNFALAVERTGEIVNDLFPHIYDTQRTIQIVGDDGRPDMVEINKPMMQDGVAKIQHDMSSGSYDVVMEQGPSYATKREQAQDGMTEFLKAFPPAAPLIGDIYAKSMDWPHAQEIGERLEEALPPAIKQKLQAERQEREQASGKPPAPPTPQEQQAAAAQQQQQQMAQQAAGLEMAQKKAETDKAEAEARKAIAEADKMETEAKILKQRLASSHMNELRDIHRHDFEMERDINDARQGQQHTQDRHAVDMTVQGLNAGQGIQRHAKAMEPQETETVQ